MYLITTTQRCGSTWLTRILQTLEQEALRERTTFTPEDCRARYINGTRLGFALGRPTPETAFSLLAARITKLAVKRAGRYWGVFKTHDIPSKDFDRLAEVIPDLRILTVERDFKDVIISRFFYFRYYWPTELGLGKMSRRLSQGLDEIKDHSDSAALKALIGSKLFRDWAKEWAAFQLPFTTPNALRVSYEKMLDGAAFQPLEEFVGRHLPTVDPFTMEQVLETTKTGRIGKARFNRQGTAGQWLSWFTPGEGARLDTMADRALKRQGEKLRNAASPQPPFALPQCA